MKKSVIFLFLWVSGINLFAQFNLSGDCQINVYDPAHSDMVRENIVNATVKIIFVNKNGSSSLRSQCSGTLVNRNTSDNDIGFYILTARHCINNMDTNENQYVIFNYQSPNANSNSTSVSNRGNTNNQSVNLNGTDYEYLHETRISIVGEYTWGDFALLKLLTPVPPHYNISYAGWDLQPSIMKSPFEEIHHPKGDIKKVSRASTIVFGELPIAQACYTITTLIDAMFGWLWGHKWSTQNVCKYVDNPWDVVSAYSYGISQEGSSGSGLFNASGQLFGILSGGFGNCGTTFAGATYVKFKTNYSNTPIKGALNPADDYLVDIRGLGSRKITLYENLTLPGGNLTHGYYFPANHYQPDNKVVLRAKKNINTTHPITIFTGADYDFIAGEKITLGTGFRAQQGSNFRAVISPQLKSSKSVEPDRKQMFIDELKSIDLPKRMDFNINNYLQDGKLIRPTQDVSVYPNPATDIINIKADNFSEINGLSIYGITGNLIYDKKAVADVEHIDVHNYPPGLYLVKIQYIDGKCNYVKVVIQ
jgi:hypothetical protein